MFNGLGEKKLGTDPPSVKTILAINKKFDSTGSVLTKMPGKGRPKTTTTLENVVLVEAAIKRDPKKSLRALAADLGLTRSSISRIKQEVDKNENLEIKTLQDTVLALNEKIEILQQKLDPLSISSSTSNDGVPNVLPMFDGSTTKFRDPLFNLRDKDGIQSLNLSEAMMHLTPVMSSTENNGTQIVHVDPETFRLLQAHCSKGVESKGNYIQS